MFKINKLAQNNKGAALITVVISMFFVIALGAALLYAAQTGYTIQLTQKNNDDNFYDANSVMEDMRLGVQSLLSTSITEAYTEVLADYVGTHPANYNPQTEFNKKITEKLLTKTISINSVDTHFFTSSDFGVTISGYNPDALKALIRSEARGLCTVTGSIAAETATDITIRALSVEYIENGYQTGITSDITITMPNFYASSSMTNNINNYAIIANNTLQHSSGGASSISGGIFAGDGGLVLSANGNDLALTKGNLICKGPVSVGNDTQLDFIASSYDLWAKEITVGASAVATLDGNVYVNDDLILNGNGANVTLKNTYFGFGSSTTSSDSSSSILISGRGSTLNINELTRLSLAGIGFIDFGTSGTETYSIPMGESMSVPTDQLAYLVPVECIANYPSNPCIFSNTADITPTINMDTTLWGTKKLSDYIDNNPAGKGVIKTLYKPLGSNEQIAYVFLIFSNKTYANAYFKDYFSADPNRIAQYMKIYVSLSEAAGVTISSGNTFYMDDNSTPANKTDDILTLNPASDQAWANGAQLRFESMTSTTPYQTFVDTAEITDKLGTTARNFVDASGNVVAVVSPVDYTYDTSSSDKIRLIISLSNVTISDTYKGIVLAGNNVYLSNNVTGQPLDTKLLNASCTIGSVTYKLSDFIKNGEQFGNSSSTTNNLWDLDSLVTYSNWSAR